jgi:hypothetical protein
MTKALQARQLQGDATIVQFPCGKLRIGQEVDNFQAGIIQFW